MWIGASAVLDVSAMFVPNPRVATYATGSLLDAGAITLYSAGTIVAEAGSQFRLEGGAATIEVPNQTLFGSRSATEPLWSNGGSLQIAGLGSTNVYFAGTVSAGGGAPQAAGGSLTIGNIPVPTAVASYVAGGAADNQTLAGNLSGPGTIVIEPGGNIAANLAAARQASGDSAIYPLTPADLAALTPSEQGGYIGADTLSNSGFSSVSLYASTIAFGGSVNVSVPGALTLVAGEGSFVLLPASQTLLPAGITSAGSYTLPACSPAGSCIPGIGGPVVNLDAGYVRLVGSGGGGKPPPAPPQVADGALNVTAKWIDLERVIAIDNALNVNFTSAGAIRLLPDTYDGFTGISNGNQTQIQFAGALSTAGNLTLTAAEIFPVSQTQFLLASIGTLASVDNTLTIRQNGVAAAPLSAGGTIALDAENIVQGGSLWAPLGNIIIGLNNPGQIPSQVVAALNSNTAGDFVATQNVTLRRAASPPCPPPASTFPMDLPSTARPGTRGNMPLLSMAPSSRRRRSPRRRPSRSACSAPISRPMRARSSTPAAAAMSTPRNSSRARAEPATC